jgi:biotin carboxyl carrier protein
VRLRVTLGERELLVVLPDLPGGVPDVDEAPLAADLRPVAPGLYSVLLDGRSFEVAIEAPADGAAGGEAGRLSVDGRSTSWSVEDERRHRSRRGAAAGESAGGGGAVTIAAPMPGRVVAVPVAAGESVERGQTVVVLEAMKMESALTTPHAGRVVEVLVSPGQTVRQRQALVRVDG